MEEIATSATYRSSWPTKRFEKNHIAKFGSYLEFDQHSQLEYVRNWMTKLDK